MSIDKISKELALITKELDRLKRVEFLMDQLLEEETIKALPNYEYLNDRYGAKGATRISTNKSKSKIQLSNNKKPEFIDSVYAPAWAQKSEQTYKKNINAQLSLAKSKGPCKININKKPNSDIKWINPTKDEVIDKFEHNSKQYIIYKGDLFDDVSYKYIGSISGGKITISDEEIVLSNTDTVELREIPDSNYYKCVDNYAYQLINGLANRIGEIKDGDIYAYA